MFGTQDRKALEKRTVKELREIAKNLSVPKASSLNKAPLIDAILDKNNTNMSQRVVSRGSPNSTLLQSQYQQPLSPSGLSSFTNPNSPSGPSGPSGSNSLLRPLNNNSLSQQTMSPSGSNSLLRAPLANNNMLSQQPKSPSSLLPINSTTSLLRQPTSPNSLLPINSTTSLLRQPSPNSLIQQSVVPNTLLPSSSNNSLLRPALQQSVRPAPLTNIQPSLVPNQNRLVPLATVPTSTQSLVPQSSNRDETLRRKIADLEKMTVASLKDEARSLGLKILALPKAPMLQKIIEYYQTGATISNPVNKSLGTLPLNRPQYIMSNDSVDSEDEDDDEEEDDEEEDDEDEDDEDILDVGVDSGLDTDSDEEEDDEYDDE